jgi:hypothetical protein
MRPRITRARPDAVASGRARAYSRLGAGQLQETLVGRASLVVQVP